MLHIDYSASLPIHKQVEEQLASLIATGALRPNDWLPSVRQLAMDISINPNTVQRAYSALEEKGIIVSVKGRGSFVSPDVSAAHTAAEQVIGEMIKDIVSKSRRNGWDNKRLLEFFTEILEKEGDF